MYFVGRRSLPVVFNNAWADACSGSEPEKARLFSNPYSEIRKSEPGNGQPRGESEISSRSRHSMAWTMSVSRCRDGKLRAKLIARPWTYLSGSIHRCQGRRMASFGQSQSIPNATRSCAASNNSCYYQYQSRLPEVSPRRLHPWPATKPI
jgi:hypothetical protein